MATPHPSVVRASAQRSFLSLSARLTAALGAVLTLLAGTSLPLHAQATVTTTTLAVTSAGNPVSTVTAGTVVTLTATVKAGITAVTPGQVNLCDATAAHCTDIHLLGTAQLTSAGTAAFKFIPGTGSHSYKAVFLGTSADAASSSSVSTLSVTGITPTTTSIAATGVAGNYTLAATVTGTGAVSPTGTVAFLDTSNANYALGSATLGPVASTLSFVTSANPATGPYPSSVAVGDFNGDGIADIVVANYGNLTGGESLTILLGHGDGTFTAEPVSPATGTAPYVVVVGDFNGDGIPDLAVANSYSDTLTILLGKGDGTFTTAASPATGYTPTSIAVGDFNGDGNADLAVSNSYSNTISILLGDGHGNFTPAASPVTGSYPYFVATGDFNGDGIPDLAVANSHDDTLTILLGKGDGTFTTAASPSTGSFPASIAVGDFNGDGNADLAIVNAGVDAEGNTVTILLGDGHGNFTVAPSPVTATFPRYIAVADFNGDGYPDLAVADEGGNAVTILLGRGDGTFTATAVSPPTGSYPDSIAVGDFNGDGVPDVVVPNQNFGSSSSTETATVLLAQRTEMATASANGISPVGTGTHNVYASYPGDTSYGISTSSAIGLTAQKVMTGLMLSANPASSSLNQQVALTATLSPYIAQNHSTDTETVTFYNGNASIGTGILTSGVAVLNITSLPAGTDSLHSTFATDANFLTSTSNTLLYPVAAFGSGTLAVSSAANPTPGNTVTVPAGSPVTVTLTLLDIAGNPYNGGGASIAIQTPSATAALSAPVLGNGTITETLTDTVSEALTLAASYNLATFSTANATFVAPAYIVTVNTDESTGNGVASNCIDPNLPTYSVAANANCGLRDAVAASNALRGVTTNISFALPNPSTILIQQPGGITITQSVNLNGASANQLTIEGGTTPLSTSNNRIFNFNANVDVGISSMTLANAYTDSIGGAINGQTPTGKLSVNNITFSGNRADSGGGAISVADMILSVSNSTFSANQGGSYGGAILSGTTSLVVANSTFSGNSAGTGGAIFTHSLNVSNSIFSGDIGSTGSGIDASSGGTVTNIVYYGDTFSRVTPVNSINADPNLAPLANYGGPTQTLLPLPGSAAICAGTQPSLNSTPLTTDQRGVPISPTRYGQTACYDVGAVQTAYALTLGPTPVVPSLVTPGSAISPAPVATITENGIPFTTGVATINMTDADSDLSGTSTASLGTNINTGQATFSNLLFTGAESTDALTATLPLNTNVSPAISLSATSNTFQVGQLTPTITVFPPSSITYGTPSIGLSAMLSWSGFVAPTGAVTFLIDSSISVPATCISSGNCTATYNSTNLSAGPHTLTAGIAADTLFTAATSNSVQLYVSQATPSITPPVAPAITYGTGSVIFHNSISYTGPAAPTGNLFISIDGGPLVPGTCQPAVAGTLNCITQFFSPAYTLLAAGSHSVVASIVAQDNYTAASSAPGTLTVNPAPVNVSIIGNPNKPYDGTTAATLTSSNYQVNGLFLTDAITVTQPNGNYAAATAGPETVTVALAASNFAATTGSLNNYILPTFASGPGTINQAPSVTTVTCSPSSVTYNGTAQMPCTATVTSTGLNQSVPVIYGANTNVGTASANAVFTGDANHSGSSYSTTFAITPAPQLITLTAPASPDIAGDTVVLSAIGGASGSPVVFSILSGPASLASDGKTLTYTGTGTVIVVANQTASTNGDYAAATEATATITVNPAAAAYNAGTVPVASHSSVLSAMLNLPNGGTLGSLNYLTQGAPNLDFVAGTPTSGGSTPTCSVGTVYFAGQICTVSYIFQPTRPGQRLGAVTALDIHGNPMGTAYLAGLSTGPQIGFSPGTVGSLGINFQHPEGVAVDSTGNVYIADQNAGELEKIVAVNGRIPSTPSIVPLVTGVGPVAVAVDGAGNLYYEDAGYAELRELVAVGGSIASSPSSVTLASNINQAYSLAVDAKGDVYFSSGSVVEELVSVVGSIPSGATAVTLSAGFNDPHGLAVDPVGDVFVADSNNGAIKEIVAVNGIIPSNPQVITVATGFPGVGGLAIDADSNVYFADFNGSAVRKILAVNGTIPTNPTIVSVGSGFYGPTAVALDGNGNVYVADSDNSAVKEIDVADAPSLAFASTDVGLKSSDSPRTVTVGNNGYDPTSTNPLTFSGVSTGTPNFLFDPMNSCTSSSSLEPGQTCALEVAFKPQAPGAPLIDAVTLADNNLNHISSASSPQTVPLSGNGLQQGPGITVAAAAITYGTPMVVLSATINFAGATAPTGSVIFTIDSGASVSATCSGTISPLTCTATYPVGTLHVTATHTITASIAATPGFLAASGTNMLTVTPLPVTLTAGNYSGVYDGHAHSPSACTSSNAGVTCADSPASVGPGVSSGAVNPVPLFTTGNAADYTVSAVTGVYSITRANPVITWASPAAITYGTPLSNTQLDATANVPGTFFYTAPVVGINPAGTLLPAGVSPLGAGFTPTDSTDYNSISAYVQITVNKATTTTTIAVTTTQAVTGTTATITTTVHPQIGGTPTGTVTYYNGTTSLGSAPVGTPFTTPVLPVGTDQLSAVYSGDGNFLTSTSAKTSVTSIAPTNITLIPALNHVFYPASSVAYTVIVPLKLLQLVSGTITIYDGTTVIGTYNILPTGVLVGVTPQLSVGTHNLRAVYSGNSQYPPGESPIETVTVTAL